MPNAAEILHEDYDRLVELLCRYDESAAEVERRKLIDRVLARLAVVEALEQEIVFPAVREATGGTAPVESGVEQYGEQLKMMQEVAQNQAPQEREARFRKLADAIRRHVRVAEEGLLPKLKAVDADELGERMVQRRQALERTRMFL